MVVLRSESTRRRLSTWVVLQLLTLQQLSFLFVKAQTCTNCPEGSSPYQNGESCCDSGEDLFGNPIHYTSGTCASLTSANGHTACPDTDTGTCCDEACSTTAITTPETNNCTQCPCNTYAFWDGAYCCRQNNDGYGNAISYSSLTCNNNDLLACPSGNLPGSCCDNTVIEGDNTNEECGNCPDGTVAYANGLYCCRQDQDVAGNPLAYISPNCFDNDFVACPAKGICCDTITNVTIANEPLPFSFEINPVGEPFAIFSDERSSPELILNYNTSARDTLVQVYTEDCETVISDGSVTGNITILSGSGGFQDAQVTLGIDTTTIASSSSGVWSQAAGSTTGYINVCVRVSLTHENISVNFHETRLVVIVDMASSFDITSVEANRKEAGITSMNAELDYYVDAYQCTDAGDRDYTTLSQGSILTICIETNATNVRVGSIQSLKLNQTGSDAVTTPIKNGVADGLTSALPCVLNKCMVRTMMVSSFFRQGTTNPVTVSGTAVFAFGSSTRRQRQLLPQITEYQRQKYENTLALIREEEDVKASPFDTKINLASHDVSDPLSSNILNNPANERSQEDVLKQSILAFLMTMIISSGVIFCSVSALSKYKKHKEEESLNSLSDNSSYEENEMHLVHQSKLT